MEPLTFDGRVAVITGAGSGMGREHAVLLASRGARVVVNDLSAEAADAVVEEITASGGTAVADHHDVAAAGASVVGTAIDTFGSLDIAINNAGIVRFGFFADQDPREWWNVFNTHLRGTVELSRAAWPHLVASGTGRLINVVSAGMLSEPGISAYSAAKGAIWGLSNTLAEEGETVGIKVHTIMPIAWTPMVESAPWPAPVEATMREHFTCERVATFVAWLAHQNTTATSADTKTFRVGGGHAGRGAFSILPAVRPKEQTIEGWAAVAEALVADSDDLRHHWSQSGLVTHELVTANPALESLLGASPTSGAGDVAGAAD